MQRAAVGGREPCLVVLPRAPELVRARQRVAVLARAALAVAVADLHVGQLARRVVAEISRIRPVLGVRAVVGGCKQRLRAGRTGQRDADAREHDGGFVRSFGVQLHGVFFKLSEPEASPDSSIAKFDVQRDSVT